MKIRVREAFQKGFNIFSQYFTIFAQIKYFVLFSKASPKRNWDTLSKKLVAP